MAVMRAAVLGDPVEHSLSPVLHRAGYAALGLDWSYDAHRVALGGLGGFVAGLDDTWRGLSLTMPLKREALALAPSVTERARLAGAANTLVLQGGRPVLADNTDLPGAVAAVRERYDGPVTAGTVLGGGATAASTGLALAELGATTITVLVRDRARAAETVAAIAAHPSRPRVEVGDLSVDPVHGELLVSTIPAAAQDGDLLARCAEAPVVFEVIYDPWPTPLVEAAAGRVVVSGLDLLVHQAVLQMGLFTGSTVEVGQVRAAGESALAARRSG